VKDDFNSLLKNIHYYFLPLLTNLLKIIKNYKKNKNENSKKTRMKIIKRLPLL